VLLLIILVLESRPLGIAVVAQRPLGVEFDFDPVPDAESNLYGRLRLNSWVDLPIAAWG
jgi:hypothetical protein